MAKSKTKQLAINQSWFAPFLKNNVEIGSKFTEAIIVKPQLPFDENTNMFSFALPHLGDQYINLHSVKLYVKGKLLRTDGTDLAAKEEAALSNFALASLFKKMNLIIGKNQCLIEYDNYPFIAHRNILDNEPRFSRNLEHIGYFPNDGSVTSTGTGTNKVDKIKQYEEKKKLCQLSQDVEFLGHLSVGFFDVNSYLMKNCPLTIELIRSEPNFYVHAIAAHTYKFNISEIYLCVDLINAYPVISESLESQIASHSATYTFPHIVMRKFAVPQKTDSMTLNIWEGVLPQRIAMGIIAQNQILGSKGLCPHVMKPDIIKKINVKINERNFFNVQYPRDELLSYSKFVEFSKCGKMTDVSFGTYKNSDMITVLDFNILCNKRSCFSQEPATGEVRIEVGFGNDKLMALPQTLVVYAFTNAQVTIDKDRNADFTSSV